MNSPLPDALADALGRIVADVQREGRKDLERLSTEARAVVAELRADILGLKAELKDATTRELAHVAEVLASVKDGEPGKDGQNGKDADPGKDGADGKDGEPGANGIDGRNGVDGLNGKDADPDLIAVALAEAFEALPKPQNGKDADPEQVAALVAIEVSKAVAALPGARDGRDGLPGLQGEKGLDGKHGTDGLQGKDGKDGVDGLGFDDLSVEHDGERTITLRFVRGDQIKEFPILFPVPMYRGVYKSGTQYQKGDAVTFGGSTHIAENDTTEKPESGKDWRLAVKHGRDGKDGKNGERGLQGIEGKAGRDLTQIGPDGTRW